MYEGNPFDGNKPIIPQRRLSWNLGVEAPATPYDRRHLDEKTVPGTKRSDQSSTSNEQDIDPLE